MCCFHRSGFLRTYASSGRSHAQWSLSSLAGNIDSHHQVAIADLILAQSRVVPTVERLLQTVQPDVVGLSLMPFQRPPRSPSTDLATGYRSRGRVAPTRSGAPTAASCTTKARMG